MCCYHAVVAANASIFSWGSLPVDCWGATGGLTTTKTASITSWGGLEANRGTPKNPSIFTWGGSPGRLLEGYQS